MDQTGLGPKIFNSNKDYLEFPLNIQITDEAI